MSSIQINPLWRKALTGAKLLLSRRALTRKRVTLANAIGNDPHVTARLLDQAIACICARKGLSYEAEVARIKMGTTS